MTHKEFDVYCECYSGGAVDIIGDWLANSNQDYELNEYEIDGFDLDELLNEKEMLDHIN